MVLGAMSRSWRYLRSYFNNETEAPFQFNAYQDVDVKEGKLRRKHRKVGFIELFLDLFLVASLSLFTSETDFGNGEKWASYCAFFVGLWSTWNAQVIYDVRFGGEKTDGVAIFWTFLQLCVYGMLAAVAGTFHIGYGLPAYENPVPNPAIPPWISPTSQIERPSIVKRSLKVTFGVFAISRFQLFFQYAVVMAQAQHARQSRRPAFFAMCGLLTSGVLFFGAMIASWGEFGDSKRGAITRIILFALGWLIEYAATVASVLSSSSITIELEYWLDRFAALTLVILGEGVFGLFESYRSTFLGPTGGFQPTLVAITIAGIGLYRVLYYLYFSTFANQLRRNTTTAHLSWGFLHLPTHLALLLLMQAAVRNIRTISIFYSADPFAKCQVRLDAQAQNLANQQGSDLTLSAYQDLLLYSDTGECLNRWSTYMGVNRVSQINLYASIAFNNITLFGNLCQAQSYSVLLRVFTSFKFEAEAGVYDKVNTYINGPQNDEALLEHALDELFSVLYKSAKPAVTCLGGFLLFLSLLGYFQPVYSDRFGKIKLGLRAGIGLAMLILTLLNIGTTSYTQQTPMDTLLGSSWLVPFLFFTGILVVVLDAIVYLCKRGAKQNSASSTSSTRSPTTSDSQVKR